MEIKRNKQIYHETEEDEQRKKRNRASEKKKKARVRQRSEQGNRDNDRERQTETNYIFLKPALTLESPTSFATRKDVIPKQKLPAVLVIYMLFFFSSFDIRPCEENNTGL